MSIVDVPQYAFAKWTFEAGNEEQRCNKENFQTVTKTQGFFYTFGKASMGLVFADPSGELLQNAIKSLKAQDFSKSYQKIRTETTEALDAYLFDEKDQGGMN